MDEPNLYVEDAKFMLVSCSAFVNYTIVKAQKAGIKVYLERETSRSWRPGAAPFVLQGCGFSLSKSTDAAISTPLWNAPKNVVLHHYTFSAINLTTSVGEADSANDDGDEGVNMVKDDITLLFRYDRWANGRVLQAASTLSAEQFTRDLGGAFRSVRDTIVHIIGGEWGWLTYWNAPSHSSAFLTELWNRHDTLFRSDAFPDFPSVRRKWEEVEREQIDFVDGLTEGSLGKMLPVRGTQVSLAHLMQHLANHSTYHRGQVSLMMRQLSAEPVATDFARFLWEGPAS